MENIFVLIKKPQPILRYYDIIVGKGGCFEKKGVNTMKVFFCLISLILIAITACSDDDKTGPVTTLTNGIFVATGGNDANSGTYAAPVHSLQRAVELAAATNYTNIYVAEGTYLPGSGLSNRTAVNSYSGLRISEHNMNFIGGWNASYTERIGYSTLSGAGTTALYHVVWIGSVTNVHMDGFIIRDGNSNGGSDHNYGGGIHLQSAQYCRLTNCYVTANSAVSGGGVSLQSSSYNNINITIVSNTATSIGGGCYLSSSDYNIIKGSIASNQAGAMGGGLCIYYSDHNTSTAVIKYNHSDSSAGGIYINTEADYNTIAGTVSGNTADMNGAGITISGHSMFNTITAVITGNLAGNVGGGMSIGPAHCNTINTVITGNSASSGAGIALSMATNNTISGVISGNIATTGSSAVYYGTPSTDSVLFNCIMTNCVGSYIVFLEQAVSGVVISNCTFGGANASSITAIHEHASDITGHVLKNNSFYTNVLGYLYRDFNNGTTTQISDVNSTVFTGAATTSGNLVSTW